MITEQPSIAKTTLPSKPRPRVNSANRDGIVPIPARLDELIPGDHPARMIWAAIETLDLSSLYVSIKAVDGYDGRSATDPKILLALWVFALSNGVVSARALADLCVEHVAYLWLCGGVPMNYHTLSDFRTHYADALDELAEQILGRLLFAGVLDLHTIVQDGLRVRASAGASSFHRTDTVNESLERARAHLKAVRERNTDEGEDLTAQQKAARERAAREKVERLERAQKAMAEWQAAAEPEKRDEVRVSTTDPDARTMRFSDGGYRPALNVQVGTTLSRFIVEVEVSPIGSDMGQVPPMVDSVEDQCTHLNQSPPQEWITDGGFIQPNVVKELNERGITLVGPVPKKKGIMSGSQPHVVAWRDAMQTEAMQTRYARRKSTVELVNARLRKDFNLFFLPIRGLIKVKSFLLLMAIAHNLRYGIPALLKTA